MSISEVNVKVSKNNHEDRENGIFSPKDELDPKAKKKGPNQPRRSI